MQIDNLLNIITATVLSIGGTTLVVLGLSSWLGKVWANRILLQDKNKYEKEMEALKANNTRDLQQIKAMGDLQLEQIKQILQRELATREIFHQISKETYKRIFDNKIATYTELLRVKSEYLKTIHEDEQFESEDYPPRVYYEYFRKIQKLIIENRLFISNSLSDKFDLLYFKISRHIREVEIIQVQGEINNKYWEDIEENKDDQYRKMISETSVELSELNSQIDSDVSEIRKWLDLGQTIKA